jgi:plasmid stabilization system protein ParE
MACQINWSPTAKLDLKNLAEYIEEDDPVAAAKFVQNVFQSVEHLPQFPNSGRVVPEFGNPDIREVIRSPCRVVYRVKRQEQLIEVVRGWHSARGIPEL